MSDYFAPGEIDWADATKDTPESQLTPQSPEEKAALALAAKEVVLPMVELKEVTNLSAYAKEWIPLAESEDEIEVTRQLVENAADVVDKFVEDEKEVVEHGNPELSLSVCHSFGITDIAIFAEKNADLVNYGSLSAEIRKVCQKLLFSIAMSFNVTDGRVDDASAEEKLGAPLYVTIKAKIIELRTKLHMIASNNTEFKDQATGMIYVYEVAKRILLTRALVSLIDTERFQSYEKNWNSEFKNRVWIEQLDCIAQTIETMVSLACGHFYENEPDTEYAKCLVDCAKDSPEIFALTEYQQTEVYSSFFSTRRGDMEWAVHMLLRSL